MSHPSLRPSDMFTRCSRVFSCHLITSLLHKHNYSTRVVFTHKEREREREEKEELPANQCPRDCP